jgi:hypothetical protein
VAGVTIPLVNSTFFVVVPVTVNVDEVTLVIPPADAIGVCDIFVTTPLSFKVTTGQLVELP